MSLLLVPATLETLDAAVTSPAALARALSADVADGWPGFPEVLPALRDAYAADPRERPWGTQLFVLAAPRTLVGMGGYKGEPSPDGVVEIGYAIAPAFQGRGLATQAARLLVERAFADARVTAVDAHTLAQPNPSTRVLEKIGMQRIAEIVDPDDGAIWHWRLTKS